MHIVIFFQLVLNISSSFKLLVLSGGYFSNVSVQVSSSLHLYVLVFYLSYMVLACEMDEVVFSPFH